MPSEASVKFFDETFFQKSFDLALDLSGRQPEKKLGKQRSVFPGRWGTKKVASRKLGSKASFCPLSRLTAPAPPRGEPSLASPFGGRWCPVGTVQRLTEPAGESAPAGGGEGQPVSAAHVRYPLDEHERQRAAIGANREPRHWAPRAEDGKMSTLSKKPGFMRVL